MVIEDKVVDCNPFSKEKTGLRVKGIVADCWAPFVTDVDSLTFGLRFNLSLLFESIV